MWVSHSALYAAGHGFKFRPAGKTCIRKAEYYTSRSMTCDTESIYTWIINHNRILLFPKTLWFVSHISQPSQNSPDSPKGPDWYTLIILNILFRPLEFSDDAKSEENDMERQQCLILRNCTNICFKTETETWNIGRFPHRIKMVQI
jgi:hypothetical protein